MKIIIKGIGIRFPTIAIGRAIYAGKPTVAAIGIANRNSTIGIIEIIKTDIYFSSSGKFLIVSVKNCSIKFSSLKQKIIFF